MSIFIGNIKAKEVSVNTVHFSKRSSLDFIKDFFLIKKSKPIKESTHPQETSLPTLQKKSKSIIGVKTKKTIHIPKTAFVQKDFIPLLVGTDCEENGVEQETDDGLTIFQCLEPSGRQWVNRFMPSMQIDDLKNSFRKNVRRFIAAMKKSGIQVRITNTYRPVQRSYLMYYSAQIARNQVKPMNIPQWPGVNIDWAHRQPEKTIDLVKAVSGAQEMVSGYGLGNNPVARPGRSSHNFKTAIDMVITEFSTKTVKDARGRLKKIKRFTDLKAVGATYGVIWYGPGDAPHWSQTGN